MAKFDYLIVGAGLFGSVFAQQCIDNKKSVIVIDKRNHIAGNCYTQIKNGVHIHKYGPHIFHTNSKKIWDYINQFGEFYQYTYSPLALYFNKVYSLPFNMWTFNQLWGINTPEEAKSIIDNQTYKGRITNLETQALATVGTEIYEKFIKYYTIKHWQTDPKKLPPSIIKRIPVRYEYNNNYFNDEYQGLPKNGYAKIIDNLLTGSELVLNTDYISNRSYYESLANRIVYTGKIDEYYNYEYGELSYRSLKFEDKVFDISLSQGVAVINHTDDTKDYTRTVEHRLFMPNNTIPVSDNIDITIEIPIKYTKNSEPYYPINTEYNNKLYQKYKHLYAGNKIFFGGRLAEYKYHDMHQVIGSALNLYKKIN